jgi:K+-transporting ATPase ATPase B chain
MAGTVVRARSLFDMAIVKPAIVDSFRKLTFPRQVRNPVMFVVYIGSILTTLLWVQAVIGQGEAPPWFIFWVSVWLWFTALFANFAEAMAEGRGKAQAASLRKARRDLQAKRLTGSGAHDFGVVSASALRKGDRVLVEVGDFIPADGTVVEGIASVNEAAITGESAPVIREAGGDRSSVTGGTQVLSDWIVVEVTANPGEAFLDRMIALVEGARRQKTPNEIALDILLAALTIVFLLATATLLPFSLYSVEAAGRGTPVTVTGLVALLVCLIPTTIGALLSAIGIAGMDRMIRNNVIAMSGRAVEAAGDVDVLLLDKTGTITLGNRQATGLIPAAGVPEAALADAAQLASLADETPEGRSIVILAKERYQIREREIEKLGATFVPFTAQTRMSGVNLNGRQVRKGAADAIEDHVKKLGGHFPEEVRLGVDMVAKAGATPLVVCDGSRVLGVVQLKDIVKGGIRERFAQLRRMGIKTIMITGDNPLTAAAISAEAGVDARGQAQADPRRAGAGPAGGHDRRRHQRRPRAGPGRRRGGDEHRHPGGQGSRQHDRPGLQSDEAARGGGDRQADADDARRAHHLQHRQRRGQVFRDHPGRVREHLSVPRSPQHHGAGHAPQRDPLRGHLQRPDHRGLDSARSEGRALPRDRRRGGPAASSLDLWGGGNSHPLPGHQDRRHDPGCPEARVKGEPRWRPICDRP